MYTGFKPNKSLNRTGVSMPPETQLETLQREVDQYTRKLEQEKRKFFSIQDTLKIVTQQYEDEKTKLNKLRKETTEAQSVILQAKVKHLESSLAKAVSVYDDTVALNNKLKLEIDNLRREKKNYQEAQRSLADQISKVEAETSQKAQIIAMKRLRIDHIKGQVDQLSNKNEQEKEEYLKNFESLQKDYLQEKRMREQLRIEKTPKPELVDTQPILKNRLKRLIGANKDKIRMVEQYRKQMRQIEEAFEDIRTRSGINDLEQITNTFIKSEEQNYMLYNYMDTLSQNIDQLQDQNAELERKIQLQKEANLNKFSKPVDTVEQERRKAQLDQCIEKRDKAATELNSLIGQIQTPLHDSLIKMAQTSLNDEPQRLQDYQLNFDLNERTIEQYLSDLEKYINGLLVAKQRVKTKVVSNLKDAVTTYSKPMPFLSYQELAKDKQTDKEDTQFIKEDKMRQYVAEFLEKRKSKFRE